MRSVRSAIMAGLVLSAALLGCQRITPGLNVNVTVSGGGKPAERVTGVVAHFDRPVVPAAAVGKDLEQAPLLLEPKVPGVLRWVDPQTLSFVAAAPLPRSTAFLATVPKGTTAIDGKGLAEAHEHRFETERLSLRLSLSRGEHGEPDPTHWAIAEQPVVLSFNQPVEPSAIEKYCAFEGPQRIASKVAIEASSDGEAKPEGSPSDSGPTRERWTAKPSKALARGQEWRFRCESALAGIEGRLGLPVAGGDADSDKSNQIAFVTHGDFIVKEISPSGKSVTPDDVTISVQFTTPLRSDQSTENLPIEIEPEIECFPGCASVYQDKLRFEARTLPPHTSYRIHIGKDLEDAFGQKLGSDHTATFRTGSPEPKLDVKTGSWVVEASRGNYPVWARNVTRIEVDAAAVPEARVGDLLEKLDWWDEDAVDLAALKLPSKSQTLAVKTKKDTWGQVALDPRELIGDRATTPGLYYFALRAPEVPREKDQPKPSARELLVSFTNLGVTAKMAAAGGLVWVTKLTDGSPQANAEITIRDRKGKVKWKGRTGPDGVARTPGRATLIPASAAPPVEHGPDEGDDDAEAEAIDEGAHGESPRLLVFARVGEDLAFVDPDREGGLAAWNYSVSVDPGTRSERLRGFLHTDRGLYRPGDEVQIRGLARLMKLGQGLYIPKRKATVAVKVRDPRGEVVLTKALPLSRYGSFALTLPLPLDARLGDYAVEGTLPEGSFREQFAVEEYRAATFSAKAEAAAPQYVAGEQLRMSVSAQYLYGAPVRGGALQWRIHSRPRVVSFEQHDKFTFADDRVEERDGYAPEVEDLVTEEQGTLDKQGRARLRLKLPRDSFPQHRDLLISAEVKDESNQTVAANAVVPVYSSRLLFGLATEPYVIQAGKATALPVIAVNPAGKRVAASATVALVRTEWNCAYEAWGYGGSYRCESKKEEVSRGPLEIAADGQVTTSITPPRSGEYQIIVEGKDASGAATATSRNLWVYGAGESPWRMDDSSRFELLADKPRYEVGETAKLLVKAPTAGATALLTLERDGVLEHQLITLPAEGEALKIPITEKSAPNFYVSLLLARGRTGKGARGLPSVRMGMVNLAVNSERKRLKVEVASDRANYRPGDPVTATIAVKDASGAPVQAEVALAAADEGVLSLIAFKTPDPIATLYAPWSLGVQTATQYDRLASLPEPGQERTATGGDGPGKLGGLRSRFLATAYFNPRVETDAKGLARVTFNAPDNLTAFRLMAVAADRGDRFGSGDHKFTVSKPLQVMPALPRFLSVGDQVTGGVVVMNETGQAGTAEVKAEISGVEVTGPRTQSVTVPVGGRVAVNFPFRVARAGEVRFKFAAAMGSEHDGVEVKMPAQDPTRSETALVASGETNGKASVPITLPAGVKPESAALDVSIDPDGLAGIGDRLRDLIEYPYGCLEQTTSRLIPLVAVGELSHSLGLPELDGPKLQKYIAIAIQKIGGFQTEDGGFGLWKGSRSEPYLTAFALWGLKLARDAGHAVDGKRIDAGVAYLRRTLGEETPQAGVHAELGELGSRAFALYVLRLLDRPEPGFVTRLLEQKAKLPRFGLAFLAQALAGDASSNQTQVGALLDELLGASQPGPKGIFALIPERPDPGLDFYMSSDARTSAIATDAFLYLRPNEPQLPKLVRGLLEHQRTARYVSTQETLFSLVALSHWAKGKTAVPAAARVALGTTALHEGVISGGPGQRSRHFTRPLPASPPPLTIEATQGTVFYNVRARFHRDREHQPAISEGFDLKREYLDPQSGKPVDHVTAGAMVRVRLSFTSPEDRTRVAVSDHLPAGLEAVNSRFATTANAKPIDASRPAIVLDSDDSWWRSRIVAKDLRDDRVDVFYDYLDQGPHTLEYLARATTAGTYVAPAATVEEMYRPEVRARTEMGTLVVSGK